MNEKYDETFYVVKSEKDAAHGYVPGSIQDAWVDVTVAVAGDEAAKKYTVRLSLNEDRENYDIDCDTYMRSLVKPWVKEEMDEILHELNIQECSTIMIDVYEKKLLTKCFSSGFPVVREENTLKEITDLYNLVINYRIVLPESSYCNDLASKIEKQYRQYFSHDFIGDYSGDSLYIEIVAYTDAFYLEHKDVLNGGHEEWIAEKNREQHYDKIRLN